MRNISIGILAGMGPRSTTPFLELVLDECQKQYSAKYDIDYPHIIIYSLPTPFYVDRKVNNEQLKKSIIDGAIRLNSFDVDIIAIPCNTAHKYYTSINDECSAKVLHIVNETMKHIPKNSKVTVLATESTIASNLYQQGIQAKNCEFVFLANWQLEVNKIIYMIKNKESEQNILVSWNKLIKNITDNGVTNIVLGCTDLSVIKNNNSSNNIIDSAVCLARAVVTEYCKLK